MSEGVRLARAGALDLLRSQRKDDVHVQHLKEGIFDAIRALFGSRFALRAQSVCDACASSAYMLLSAIIPRAQTIGEEYCAIAPAPSVSVWRRALALLSQPLLTSLRSSSSSPSQSDIVSVVDIAARILEIIIGIHTVLMYSGVSHSPTVAHAVLGVDMLSLNGVNSNDSAKSKDKTLLLLAGFAAIRVVALAPGLIRSIRSIICKAKPFEKKDNEFEEGDKEGDGGVGKEEDEANERMRQQMTNAPICTLCLEPRKCAASTTCGHVFCWDCLFHALTEKPECPLCRSPQKPESIIRIHNLI